MAESDFQLVWLLYFVSNLKSYFQNRSDIYAAGNMFIYFEEGNNSAVVAPDVFVIKDVENKLRHSYKTWEENGKTPDFVMEITSKSTALVDQTAKMGLYRFLNVSEYVQFDPTRDYLNPSFQFFKGTSQGFELVEPIREVEGVAVYMSEVIGLELHFFKSENRIRLFDPATAQYLGSLAEERAAKESERAAREAAEMEIEALKAEIERLKKMK